VGSLRYESAHACVGCICAGTAINDLSVCSATLV
jgi:hypothetical protein